MAHGHRVAALCREMALRLNLGPGESNMLERAAMLHSVPPPALLAASRSRLLADLGVDGIGHGPNATPADPELDRLLSLFHTGRPKGNDTLTRLARILETCDAFDESFELGPFAPEETFAEQREELCGTLRLMDPADLRRCIGRLPVFPTAARQALALLGREDASLRDLELVIGSDQVLAGSIIQAANSAALNPGAEVSLLGHALAVIGIERARKVLCAASLKPLFASRTSWQLWDHSLRVSSLSERLAAAGGQVESGEAFLAGLVHDIGRLLLLLLPAGAAIACARLADRGCPPVVFETALFGADHAAIGAGVLEHWEFPKSVIQAVAAHHRPEVEPSALAAVLFVAEEVALGEEDLASQTRLCLACESAGLAVSALSGFSTEVEDSVAAMLRAA